MDVKSSSTYNLKTRTRYCTLCETPEACKYGHHCPFAHTPQALMAPYDVAKEPVPKPGQRRVRGHTKEGKEDIDFTVDETNVLNYERHFDTFCGVDR